MATCREVITLALKKARQVTPGEDPTADMAEDALATLQSIYDEAVGGGWFGSLTDVLVSEDYEASENERVFNNTDTSLSITCPETVTDAFTGDERPPRDRSVVVIAGSTVEAFLYSAQRGAWDDLTDLALDDFAPLSDRSKDGLASLLAVRLGEEYGAEIGPAIKGAAAVFTSMISHKRDSQRQSVQANYF